MNADQPGTRLQFLLIDHGSDAYKQTLALRERILRQPLGLSLWDENLMEESRQLHFVLMNAAAQPVACLVVVPPNPVSESASGVKIRQMAVDPDYQRQGIGYCLMQHVEQWLIANGFNTVILHARTTAIGFYESLGYTRLGSEFTEVGIPHYRMSREL